jgi:leader peptidase (prepilin peptidase)/N-methyltransferase
MIRGMAWLPLVVAPVIGSFLGTLVLRLPAGEGVLGGRSRCDACGHVLGALDLVPIASWLVLRGRCRHCGVALSAFYPAIELAALGLAAWAALTVTGTELWLGCALGWGLLALALIDYRHYLLPDGLTLPLVALGLVAAWLDDPAELAAHVIGAVAGYAAFLLIALAYRRLRGREGLGQGDAKLLAVAGAWVSWQGLPSVVLLGAGATLGLLLWQRWRGGALRLDQRVPFGPGLCLGLWLVWLYGPLQRVASG